MRDIEQVAIRSGRVTGLELMERAGNRVVDAIFEEWPKLNRTACRVAVLCGPGNNGGDGFVVARLLRGAGCDVCVYPYGWDVLLHDDPTLPWPTGDAALNAQRWRDVGGVSRAGRSFSLTDEIVTYLVIDALLGIGQKRSADNLTRDFWRAWEDRRNIGARNTVHRISIDVPTGYDCDTGAALSDRPFEADITVTFHRPKPGHTVNPMARACGKPVVKDIGL